MKNFISVIFGLALICSVIYGCYWVAKLLLENWLDASITENGEFVVADELKRQMDELED